LIKRTTIITVVIRYVAGRITSPIKEDVTPKDLTTRSDNTGELSPAIAVIKPKGNARRITRVKKKGKRRTDKLFIIMVVLNSPFFRFLITIIKDTTARAGTIPQNGKCTPISINIGKSNTRPN